MELLIISFFFRKEYYRISVHSQYTTELKSRVSKYGIIDMEASFVYSSDNKALIQGVKNGLNAYLSNHYLSPGIIGVGSSEFFDVKSIDKCKYLLNIYMKELINIKFNGSLFDYLSSLDLYPERSKQFKSESEFWDRHKKLIDQIHSSIMDSLSFITFDKRDNYYVLSNIDTRNIDIKNIPIFEWVHVKNNEILFDIDVINVWKKDGRYNDVRRIIEMRFFNEFSLKNLKLYYEIIEQRKNDNV